MVNGSVGDSADIRTRLRADIGAVGIVHAFARSTGLTVAIEQVSPSSAGHGSPCGRMSRLGHRAESLLAHLKSGSKAVNLVTDYMHAHRSEPVRMHDIAVGAGVSRQHLARIWKKHRRDPACRAGRASYRTREGAPRGRRPENHRNRIGVRLRLHLPIQPRLSPSDRRLPQPLAQAASLNQRGTGSGLLMPSRENGEARKIDDPTRDGGDASPLGVLLVPNARFARFTKRDRGGFAEASVERSRTAISGLAPGPPERDDAPRFIGGGASPKPAR